jgi:hypothetical protein
MIDKPVYDNRFVIGEQRSHAIALNVHRPINKNEADRGDAGGNQEASPNAGFVLGRILRKHVELR